MTQIQSLPTVKESVKVPMINTKKKRPLMSWFYKSPQEVLDIFAALPDAVKIGKGEKQFVFIPGTRKDRVLLVAHADTVNHDDYRPEVGYDKGTYFSKGQYPIGADDRAGCAILWNLRDSGHSLLIPNAEESGCVGSSYLMTLPEWKKKIAEHQFAIEFDRMNSRDLVHYNVASNEYKEWCRQQFTGYRTALGTYTDICQLCEDISGLNISVGYYGQHSGRETLVEKEWHNTLQITRKVLEQPDLPKFKFEKPVYNYTRRGSYYPTDYDYHDDYYNWFNDKKETESLNTARTIVPVTRQVTQTPAKSKVVENNWLVVCKHCDGMMDIAESKRNKDRCVFCYSELKTSV